MRCTRHEHEAPSSRGPVRGCEETRDRGKAEERPRAGESESETNHAHSSLRGVWDGGVDGSPFPILDVVEGVDLHFMAAWLGYES